MTDAGWIDVHAHFVTDHYVDEARASGHARPDGMRDFPSWSAADHVALLDENDIDLAVLSISSPGVHFGDASAAVELARHVNEVATESAEQHRGRFAFFASLPLPEVDASVREFQRASDELGAVGVVVESNAHGMYLGDAAMDPLYAAMSDRGAILFIHPTSPPCFEQTANGRPRPMIEFMFETARTVTDLILARVPQRFPDLPIIVPHAGGVLPLIADRIQGFMSIFGDPDQPKPDVLGALAGMHFDLAGDPLPRLIPSLLSIVPRDHILYGTDYPWTPAPGVARRLSAIDEDSTDWRASTTQSARRLLAGVRSKEH